MRKIIFSLILMLIFSTVLHAHEPEIAISPLPVPAALSQENAQAGEPAHSPSDDEEGGAEADESYIPLTHEQKQAIYWSLKGPTMGLAGIYMTTQLAYPVMSPGAQAAVEPLYDFYMCHKMDSRSFQYSNGQFMPMCARCTGISFGILFGLVDSFIWDSFQIKDWPRWKQGLLHIGTYSVLTLPMIIDGFVQKNDFYYTSNNSRRMITGLLFGYAMSAITDELLQMILDYEGDVKRR